ncbi:MAG: hypothetical protein HKN35_10950 [Woeseia sp.]|nr:hypothetical protein [Woeseia sp.]MBT8095448.1 hypothetical protein [Woeseia sp.]NNE61405.1 hypothetical protein [Woeseia sp.]NNL55248.1 hypothetical protein [Woeseia sp.]
MTQISRLFNALVCCLLLANSNASPLFENDSTLDVTLSGPLGTLLDANDDTMEMPFTLQADGVDHAIEVRIRGKSRKRVCDIPPLRLNFPSNGTEGTVFENQNKIKLVTHCKNTDASRVDVVEEYAVYKIFSLLSDKSYQVRLLSLTYTDTDKILKETTFTGHGFAIEPASALAERIGGQQADAKGVVLSTLDARQAATVYIFQYLVGNTDWSLVMADADDTCCHNGDLYDIGTRRFFVPYDFDLTGLVNARYAKPDPSLRISRVTQRRYRGYCIDPAELKTALIAIKARKPEILDVVRSLPVLSQKDIAKKVKFLEGFFRVAENEDKLIKSFDNKCL